MSHSRSNGLMGSLRGTSANTNGFMNLGRPTTSSGFTIHDAFEEEDGTDEAIKVYGNGNPLPVPAGQTNGGSKEEENVQISESRQFKYTDDTTSRDSDSLIQEYSMNGPGGIRSNNLPIYYSTTTSGGSSNNHTTCWRHPKVRENWRTVLAAFALLFVGTGLVIMGAYSLSEPNNTSQGAVFFIAGVICFIPGAYHVVYIWLAARGFRGFDFYHLPLFT